MSSAVADVNTKEDQNQLLDALQSSTGKLKVDLATKVRLVSVLVDKKQSIVAKVTAISRTTGETLQEAIPEKKGFARRNKHKDVGLVIFVAAKAFAAYKAAKIDLVVETRTKNDGDIAYQSLHPCFEMVEELKHKVHEHSIVGAKDLLVSIDPAERNRKFLQGGTVPVDPSLRSCLFCHHEYVDEPTAYNNQVKTHNEFKEKQHQLALDKWRQESKDSGGKKRAPPLLGLRDLILRCHCSQIKCNRGGGGSCERCRRNPNMTADNCGCEICNCPCAVAYKVSVGVGLVVVVVVGIGVCSVGCCVCVVGIVSQN